MKKAFILVLAALLSASCIYPFSPDLAGEVDETLVIDGDILIGENSRFNVRKMYPVGTLANAPGMLSDLAQNANYSVAVYLEDSAGNTWYGPFDGSAHVLPTEDLPSSLKYRVSVVVSHISRDSRGRTTESAPKRYSTPWLEVQEAPEIDDITFSADDRFVQVKADAHATRDGVGYYRFDYLETWEFHAIFYPTHYFDPQRGSIREYDDTWVNDRYFCWQSARPTEPVVYSTKGLATNQARQVTVKEFSRTNNRAQIEYSILLRTMGLTAESYAYYDNLIKNSNLTGSLFAANPSELRGNLRCEQDSTEVVLGYVTASTVKTRRAFLDARYYREVNHDAELFFPDLTDGTTYADYYQDGTRPVMIATLPNEEGTGTKTGVAWAQLRCIDCVEAGGTKVKPDYWPTFDE